MVIRKMMAAVAVPIVLGLAACGSEPTAPAGGDDGGSQSETKSGSESESSSGSGSDSGSDSSSRSDYDY